MVIKATKPQENNGQQNTQTALARVPQQQQQALVDQREYRLQLEPTNLADLERVAETVAKAGLYGVKTMPEAYVRIMHGRELGLSAMQSLASVYVVKGRPGLDAMTMVALAKLSPNYSYMDLVESSDSRAIYEGKARDSRRSVRISYTMKQAEKAGLATNDNYRCHPAAMLRARASSALVRILWPEVVRGLHAIQELQSLTDAGEVADEPKVEVLEVGYPTEEHLRSEVDGWCALVQSAPTEEAIVDVANKIKLWADRLGASSALRDELRQEVRARRQSLAAAAPAPAEVEPPETEADADG